MIEVLKNKCLDILNNSKDIEVKNHYQIIYELLDTKDSFLYMDIKYAYAILEDLNYSKEEIPEIYQKLISIN